MIVLSERQDSYVLLTEFFSGYSKRRAQGARGQALTGRGDSRDAHFAWQGWRASMPLTETSSLAGAGVVARPFLV